MAFPIQTRELAVEEKKILGNMLVEALSGEISPNTRNELYELGDPANLPEPFGHLVGYAQGYALDNTTLARALTEEIRGACVELLDPNYPPQE
jgi:hypothetical protein